MEERKRHSFKFREKYDGKYGNGAENQKGSLPKAEVNKANDEEVKKDELFYWEGLRYFENTYEVIRQNRIKTDEYYRYLKDEYDRFRSVEYRILEEHPEYELVSDTMHYY